MVPLSKVIKPLDPTIKVIKTIVEPHRYQVSVISEKATTPIAPQVYVVKIESDTEKLNPKSRIKGFCDCHDFRYRQAYCWYVNDGLLMEPSFVLTPPEKTNPNCDMRMCKHMASVAHYIISRNL